MDTEIKQYMTLADGNPGAATVLGEFSLYDGDIQIYLDWFERKEIVGPKLWILYKDMCGSNVIKVMKWVDNEKKLSRKKYEIEKIENKCQTCKKESAQITIVPDFVIEKCYRCKRDSGEWE